MKDVLTEAMDIDGVRDLLRRMEDGSIRCVAVDTPVPSQFSHEILNANPYAYLDDAPLEERRARAVEMRRILPESVLEEVGKLDPARSSKYEQKHGRMCAMPMNCMMCCTPWLRCHFGLRSGCDLIGQLADGTSSLVRSSAARQSRRAPCSRIW